VWTIEESKVAPADGAETKRSAGDVDRATFTVLILTYNEAGNIDSVLQGVNESLGSTGHSYEVLIVDGGSSDATVEISQSRGARVVPQRERGYGNALREGFALCEGDFVLTLDADQSHDPALLVDLIAHRYDADLVIASRYVKHGRADMPLLRRVLSVVLNRTFAFVLGVPVRDMSSGFRLYSRRVLASVTPGGRHFDVLTEVVFRAHRLGYRICEIPFHYQPRVAGRSNARLVVFGISYAQTLYRCFKLRMSGRPSITARISSNL
jgi:glycosyltransferase involved in cell wall biosynthesis